MENDLFQVMSLKLHNISVTHKIVKKVITNLDLSKASGTDCIPEVVLKNCEPELSYILAELLSEPCFSDCWKVSLVVLKFKNVGERESCIPDCWKVSLVVLKFKNVGESSTAKNYLPVSLFSLVS